jgi:uncharacterized membrane protein
VELPGTLPTGAVVHHQEIRVETFSGPLPDPKVLEYYERVCPGAAREILEMAKLEQKHRHADTRAGRWLQFSGQFFGFLLAGGGIFGGVYVAHEGQSLVGFSLFFSGLATLIGATVWENHRRAKQAAAQARDGKKEVEKRS